MWNTNVISLNQIDTDNLTFEGLRKKYGTGRAYTISGKGRDKKEGYRHGVMTDYGDIELSDWKKLARMLIQRAGEENIQKWLYEWFTENGFWIRGDENIEDYSLEIHIARLFDKPEWRDYEAFNRKYRPEIFASSDENNSENERSLHNDKCE